MYVCIIKIKSNTYGGEISLFFVCVFIKIKKTEERAGGSGADGARGPSQPE